MLTDGKPGHAATIGGSGPFRALTRELNVDCTFVELDLSLDVPPPSLDEIVFVHGGILRDDIERMACIGGVPNRTFVAHRLRPIAVWQMTKNAGRSTPA
jgi:hypothetical protein